MSCQMNTVIVKRKSAGNDYHKYMYNHASFGVNNYITGIHIVGILIIGIFLGIFLGSFGASRWYKTRNEIIESSSEFSYGTESQELNISQIDWQEYFEYRKVSFTVDGEFIVNVPSNAECTISDIVDAGCIEEESRQKFFLSDGDDLIAYDRVCYRLNNAVIRSTGLLKFKDEIEDAVSGYRLKAVYDDGEIILGYIAPMDDNFSAWTKEYNYFSNNNYETYLDKFKLSKTYTLDNAEKINESTDNIRLKKKDGGVLDCVIDNTDGVADWEYMADLPTLELWYQGVWIEVDSPFDSNLTALTCHKGENVDISVPEETMAHFSYFLPGIYRLVVWGTDGDYIVTDTFNIERAED